MKGADKILWEIMVPTKFNDGRPIRTRHHKAWDDKVRVISGGLTIYKPAIGQWISSEKELFKERMIPVRIACTESDINMIMEITMKHYDQLAVMAYVISEKVIIKQKNELVG